MFAMINSVLQNKKGQGMVEYGFDSGSGCRRRHGRTCSPRPAGFDTVHQHQHRAVRCKGKHANTLGPEEVGGYSFIIGVHCGNGLESKILPGDEWDMKEKRIRGQYLRFLAGGAVTLFMMLGHCFDYSKTFHIFSRIFYGGFRSLPSTCWTSTF